MFIVLRYVENLVHCQTLAVTLFLHTLPKFISTFNKISTQLTSALWLENAVRSSTLITLKLHQCPMSVTYIQSKLINW